MFVFLATCIALIMPVIGIVSVSYTQYHKSRDFVSDVKYASKQKLYLPEKIERIIGAFPTFMLVIVSALFLVLNIITTGDSIPSVHAGMAIEFISPFVAIFYGGLFVYHIALFVMRENARRVNALRVNAEKNTELAKTNSRLMDELTRVKRELREANEALELIPIDSIEHDQFAE